MTTTTRATDYLVLSLSVIMTYCIGRISFCVARQKRKEREGWMDRDATNTVIQTDFVSTLRTMTAYKSKYIVLKCVQAMCGSGSGTHSTNSRAARQFRFFTQFVSHLASVGGLLQIQ